MSFSSSFVQSHEKHYQPFPLTRNDGIARDLDSPLNNKGCDMNHNVDPGSSNEANPNEFSPPSTSIDDSSGEKRILVICFSNRCLGKGGSNELPRLLARVSTLA